MIAIHKHMTGLQEIRHDFLVVFFFEFSPIQQQISRHHVDNHLLKTKADLVETVIDWECARFTKPDKQLNAYETLMKFYPEYESVYLPIILELLPHEVPTQKVIQHQVNKNQVQKIKQNQR